VEVQEGSPDRVTLAAETVPASGLVTQRAPEDKPLIERAGNGPVVPRIPRARRSGQSDPASCASVVVSLNPDGSFVLPALSWATIPWSAVFW
jgi:hypothetical protein